jgi:hypothetical protein
MTQFSSLWNRLLTQELGTDDSAQLFTDARRQAGINDGIFEFADLTECFVRVATITWPGGTGEVNLHASSILADQDFVRIAAKQSVTFRYTDAAGNVTVLAGSDLPQTDVAWLDRYEPGWQISTVASSLQQLPQKFYLRPNGGALLLGFWPTPSTGSSASIAVTVPYVAKPPVLQSTDATAEPYTVSTGVRADLRIYHRASVHYAAHQLEKLRRDDQASDRQLQRFLSYVTRYAQAMRQKGGTALTFARTYFRRSLGRDDVQDPRT